MTATLLGVAAILLVGLVATLTLYACMVVGARSEQAQEKEVGEKEIENS